MDCEVLIPEKVSRRALAILTALLDTAPAAGVRCTVSQHWRGLAPVLMTWGLGHPVRRHWTDAHLAKGGRVIGWDLAYWSRQDAARVTVDADHPWRLLRNMPGHRWEASGIELRDDHDPDGPVMLVGMGVKSRNQFAMSDRSWERGTLEQIRAAYPGRKVIYRAKRPEAQLPGTLGSEGPIESALKGCSLVVCRHSNVAVDACIAGIPVVCEDGAARALYGSDLRSPVNPGLAERLQFLHNLAWWQWSPAEAEQAWKFLKPVCG